MTDFAKLQKLLNLTSSPDDAEALAALRVAQKLCGNLGDFLSSEGHGLSASALEVKSLYDELQKLFADESERVAAMKKQNEDKERQNRKLQRDVQTFKRRVDDYEERVADLEEKLTRAQSKMPENAGEAAYQELEALYQAEVDKNEELRERVQQKEKDLQKFLRENSKLKRDKKTGRNSLSQ